MVLPPSRALALALAALLLPVAAAQAPEDVEPPEELECREPVATCFPDLIPTNPRASNVDERTPTTLCTDFINIGEGLVTTPFRVRLSIDGVGVAERQFNEVYQRGQGESAVCWGDQLLLGGRHTMTITVDVYDEVIESDEGNNERSLDFVVRYTPQIDLVVSSFTVSPREGGLRMNQIFAVDVTNRGGVASNASIVTFADDNGHMGDYLVPAIAPGQTRQVAHVTRPEQRPVGTFIARVTVDALDQNHELSESNNEALLEYVVLDHPAPDLVLSDVELDGNFTEFRGVLATINVTNAGDQLAREVLVRAYNESGARIAESQAQLALGPASSASVQLRLVLRAGERVILFTVDPVNAVRERDELNNNATVAMTIVPPPVVIHQPNLVVEKIFTTPSSPRPGDNVSIGAFVRNVGVNKSNATRVDFAVDGEPIGSAELPSLPVNASFYATVGWITTGEGTYVIDAHADGPARVAELDEEDNALRTTFSILAPAPAEPEPEPPTPTTPTPATPTPATPTTPTPTTPTPGNATFQGIAFSDMQIETRPVPGGLKGVISISLRNPNLQAIGLIEVTFKVDDEVLITRLVQGIRPAASQPATSGEVDLPAGNHTVTADVRIIGTTIPVVSRSSTYEAEAGEGGGVPMGGPAVVVLALGLALALAQRRRR